MALDPVQLATFQAVIAHGSFDAAAQALHITPSAVSQRIKALEQSVGQVLLRRTRPSEPTEAGQPLIRLSGQLALLEHEALAAARGQLTAANRTRIAIVVNADSLATWFLPALADVADIDFELHTDDEHHSAGLLRAGTVMAAVTTEHAPVQGCRSRKLGAMRYLAVATPEFHETWFAGCELPAAFAAAPMIRFNHKDQLQHRFVRSVTRKDVDPPTHFVPASASFNDAVRLGLGWGLIPEQVANADIAAGQVVQLTPGRHAEVALYWQYWRLDSAALAAVTEAVRQGAETALR